MQALPGPGRVMGIIPFDRDPDLTSQIITLFEVKNKSELIAFLAFMSGKELNEDYKARLQTAYNMIDAKYPRLVREGVWDDEK